MIFYFTGTGNSFYVAKKIQEKEGGELINMVEALNKKDFNVKLEKGEKIGIIFPVYFWGPPNIVEEFLSQLEIEKDGEDPFIYTVITCGSTVGNADKIISNLLKPKDLQLSSGYTLKMPSNYVMMYDMPSKEKAISSIEIADKEIEKIIEDLKTNKKGDFIKDRGIAPILTPILYKIYGIYRKTKNFKVNENCTACGQCEKLCTSKVIRLNNGKPEWTYDKCSHCTACINGCPSIAIEYGKSTIKRKRYVNPYVNLIDEILD